MQRRAEPGRRGLPPRPTPRRSRCGSLRRVRVGPSAAQRSPSGNLDADVRCLHAGHDFGSGLQPELVHGLAREQRQDPMRSGHDLDRCRDAVLLDVHDDAGEPVAQRARRPGRLIRATLGQQPGELVRGDDPLPALGPLGAELALRLPPPERLDTDAQRLRGLSDPEPVLHGVAG